ncbi:MAG: hypothetical protein ACI9OJ_001650 [Myxococcota bacterium]|jgi:hypothetical protein
MKLVIHNVWTWDCGNLRIWEPADPSIIATTVNVDIGAKGRSGKDTFQLRIATPEGLMKIESRDGIVAIRPLLVLERYYFNDVWRWLQATVAKCEADSWLDCVANLRRWFDWEYDGMES